MRDYVIAFLKGFYVLACCEDYPCAVGRGGFGGCEGEVEFSLSLVILLDCLKRGMGAPVRWPARGHSMPRRGCVLRRHCRRVGEVDGFG